VTVLGLDHVQLAMPAGREEEARAFYGQLLGLRELAKPNELAGRGGAWFQCGDLQLHLGVEKQFSPAKKAHPALRVTHLDALSSSLIAAGFNATQDTSVPNIRRAFTEDPFGNRIELVEVKNVL
jgi:catechol 2,3-dioxygenase-like lactoylglutathione lyase family enzyme